MFCFQCLIRETAKTFGFWDEGLRLRDVEKQGLKTKFLNVVRNTNFVLLCVHVQRSLA